MQIGPYNILFGVGIMLAAYYIWHYWRKTIGSERDFELFITLEMAAIFLGARMCHCLCYEPHYYVHHPIEILLPIATMADGSIMFTGYYGLASHGGTAGAIIATLIYGKTKHHNIPQILDLAAIATPLLGTFIRIGNFFNEEIVGIHTSLPWGIVFEKIDTLPRHPVQLYEALFYITLFIILSTIYHKHRYHKAQPLLYFGISLTAISAFRFMIEFIKENQSEIETNMPLNIGQWLSLPLIIIGATIITQKYNNRHKKNK